MTQNFFYHAATLAAAIALCACAQGGPGSGSSAGAAASNDDSDTAVILLPTSGAANQMQAGCWATFLTSATSTAIR